MLLRDRLQHLAAQAGAAGPPGSNWVIAPAPTANPLNVYGWSKLVFDNVVRRALPTARTQVAGFRYFNVYGPREQHKGRMASVAWHFFNQYRAKGIPDLHRVQQVLEGLLLAGAAALFWWPRRRAALRLAAFTSVLLVGFELVLTHWFYLYLPWFFPFAAIALLAV